MEEHKRVLNFNKNEIDLLVSLVEKYSSVIECKKSDAVEWTKKNEVWEILTKEFNNHDNIKQRRNSKSLKEKWKNIKKESKKKFANEKLEYYKTGGGQLIQININENDLKFIARSSSEVRNLSNRVLLSVDLAVASAAEPKSENKKKKKSLCFLNLKNR
ncbi:hypothetical protein ABEB36_014776 [Hypothenemus hampei]|uniref:Regulatory protein zeste n=1 Tax=Hypothenemus hampei TaxID=57062 RepID=A0ABD1E2U2_HYPHA